MKILRKQDGFSMTETIMAIVVISIVSLSFAPMFMEMVGSYSLANSRSRALHDARHAMFQISRELLTVSNNSITAISPTQIDFNDSAGAPTFYRVNSGSLWRNNVLLSPNVNSLNFTYLDQDGVATANLGLIRRITIEMVIGAPGNQGTVPLRTEIFPRAFVYDNFN